jgi:hypothetical protein
MEDTDYGRLRNMLVHAQECLEKQQGGRTQSAIGHDLLELITASTLIDIAETLHDIKEDGVRMMHFEMRDARGKDLR